MNPFVTKQLKSINVILDRWLEKRSLKYPIPAEIEIVKNIPYLDDGTPSHRMDIFRPIKAISPLPVIINLHGGGLVLCTKEVNTQFCCELSKRDFLVFSVDYPLVPDADVPQRIRDVSAGMDKAASLLSGYGGDPDRVYLVGDSAGAFLAVYVTAAQHNWNIASAIGLSPSRLPVHALGLISGMFYTTSNDNVGLFLKKDFYGKDWKHHPLISYIQPDCPEIAGNLPPCILITSKSDNLHSYTMRFHRGLEENGIECELINYSRSPKHQHDFIIATPERPSAQNAIDRMKDFLLRYHG